MLDTTAILNEESYQNGEMYEKKAIFILHFLLFCSALFNTASCIQHHKSSTNLHRPVQTKNGYSHEINDTCRWVCSNQSEEFNESQTQDGSIPKGREISPLILQNLNNFPEELESLVGIVFNRTGGFRGFVHRISNLHDIIQGFPNSSSVVIITCLNRLRNNPFLHGLSRFGNQFYHNSNHVFSEELKQVANRRLILQEMFRKLPNLSGIFSSPVGLIFNPFHFKLFKEESENVNPFDMLSGFRELFRNFPSLSGIFLRPRELFNHGLRNVSNALFFGSEKGYHIFKTFFDRLLSRLNLNQTIPSASLFRVLPFLTEAIQFLPKYQGSVIQPFFNLGGILNNSSLLNEIRHDPFLFREIPEVTNYQATIVRLIENIISACIRNSNQPLDLREFFSRSPHELNDFYKFLNSGDIPSRFLIGRNLIPFLNMLLSFEEDTGNHYSNILNVREIFDLFSYGINNLQRIISTGRLHHLLDILLHVQGDIDHVAENLNPSEIINRFSYQLNTLSKVLNSGNASARFLNNSELRPFLDILLYLENVSSNGNPENLNINEPIERFSHGLNNFYKILSSRNNPARIFSHPFLHILNNFANLVENVISQAKHHCAEDSIQNNNRTQETRYGKYHTTTYPTATGNGRQIVGTGGDGTGGSGSGSVGIGGAGINEKTAKHASESAKKSSQYRQNSPAKQGITKSSSNKNSSFDVKSKGNRGAGSGTSRSGINGKAAKDSSTQRIKSRGKPANSTKPSTNGNRIHVKSIGGSGTGGSGSGSVGIGGAGINEKSSQPKPKI